MTDNLSKTLQKRSLSASMAQHIASLTVTTLSKMRTDEAFQAFFDLIESLRTSAGVEQPSLPRKRKVPRRIDDGNGGDYFSETVEEHYHLQYFEAIDLAVASSRVVLISQVMLYTATLRSYYSGEQLAVISVSS